MFRVVRKFKDSKHDHIYEVGDTYPVEGAKTSKARVELLSTDKNKHKQVYIEAVVVDEAVEVVMEEVTEQTVDESVDTVAEDNAEEVTEKE